MLGLVQVTGLIVGIIEFLIAAMAYKFYTKGGKLFEWLKAFAAAVIILGTGHILCKFIGHGLLNLPKSYALGVPFKFFGVVLMIYALLKGVEHKRVKEVTIATALIGVYFIVASYYTLSILNVNNTIWFSTSHWLFLLLIPWYVAYELYKVYKASSDETALIFSIGMILFGLATLANTALLMVGYPMSESMSVEMVIRVIAEITMLSGFFVAERS